MTQPAHSLSPARTVLLAGLFFPLLAGQRLAIQAAASPTAATTVTAPPTTPALSPTASPSFQPSEPTPSGTPIPSSSTPTSATPRPTETAAPSATASGTQTAAATATPAITAPGPGVLLINEIAWAGTLASPSDEWIELHNTSGSPIVLDGWSLHDGGDISISLTGAIGPYGFFLLERTNDSTIADLPADQIYTGALRNSGETLELKAPDGSIVDTANRAGGGWPAGDSGSRSSMERLGGDDLSGNWVTFSGGASFGHDAAGNPLRGTPRQPNSPFLATPSPTPTATLESLTPLVTVTPILPGSVLISEVAWAGTFASASDEWIELHNQLDQPVNLDGWTLSDGGDIDISLSGSLPSHSFYLLERSDDGTISDLAADLVYSGNLRNAGESLRLLDAAGELMDSANLDGGSWPAGDAPSRASMERRGGGDQPGNWADFIGHHGNGHDQGGQPIQGTPKSTNSIHLPTPTPTWIPGRVVINEVLIRPHYDWAGTGGVTTADEFIELYNHGPFPVYLRGWFLDDISGSGSKPYQLPGVTISPDGFAVFFRGDTRIALNDSGDSVRLLAPDGTLIDKISYLRVRAYNLSYGRLPDGSSRRAYGLWPTPGQANVLFQELTADLETSVNWAGLRCPAGGVPWPRVARLARFPAVGRWMWSLGYGICLTGADW